MAPEEESVMVRTRFVLPALVLLCGAVVIPPAAAQAPPAPPAAAPKTPAEELNPLPQVPELPDQPASLYAPEMAAPPGSGQVSPGCYFEHDPQLDPPPYPPPGWFTDVDIGVAGAARQEQPHEHRDVGRRRRTRWPCPVPRSTGRCRRDLRSAIACRRVSASSCWATSC